jgi:low temperature requirement protein LtrA
MVSIENRRQGRTAALARLLRPPRLRALEEAGRERHATWTELFFDLVFVVAIAELAHLLHGDPSPGGFLRFGALFVPCWWAWVLFTFYSDRFDTDDIVHRLSMLGGMLAVVALAVNLHDAFSGGWTGFVLSYLLVRSIVLALYLRAARHVPAARANLTLLLFSYFVGGGLWLLSLVVPPPLRYVVWAVGMTIEVTMPIVGMKLFARGAAVSASHLPERFGLFTIIVLGEAVVAVATGTAGTNWRPSSVVAAIAGFGIAACLWWAYFAFLERAVVIRGPWSVHLYNDGHLPILAALTMVGVGIQFAIEGAGLAPLAAGPRWALCGGVALYLATTSALYLATARTLRTAGLGVSLAVAAVALALAIFGGLLPALALEGLLLIALVGLVGYKIFHLAAEEEAAERAGEGEPEREEAPSLAIGS